MTSALFSPLKLKNLELKNRIIVSPMCQYSAPNGVAGDWHTMHIGQFAVGNPGLIFFEGTAVLPEGRISPHDLCLYNDVQTDGIARVVRFVKQISGSAIGVQLFHSGRKGSQYRPWDNCTEFDQGDTIQVDHGGWTVKGPSSIPYSDDFPKPEALTDSELREIREAFVNSAERALAAEIDTVEIHYAHGYLLHSFLSEVSNQRTDQFGGSFQKRMRYPLEVFEAVRKVWPSDKPLGARISGEDFGTNHETNWGIEQAILFAQELERAGCDYLDVSGGFLSPDQDFFSTYGPGFQVNLAAEVKRHVGIPVFSVGVIAGAKQADSIIKNRHADAVAIARGMLYDPRWPWHAAYQLGETPKFPPQYERAFSYGFPEMFDATK